MKRLTVTRAQPVTLTRAALEAKLNEYVARYNQTLVENKKLRTRAKTLKEKVDELEQRIQDLIEEHNKTFDEELEKAFGNRVEEIEQQAEENEALVDHVLTVLEDIQIAAGAGRFDDIPALTLYALSEPKWASVEDCQKAFDSYLSEKQNDADRQKAIAAAHLLETKIVIEAPKYGARIKRRA